MRKYITQSGDSWDKIAFKIFGDERYVEDLINANREHLRTFIFSAGIEISIPDVSRETKKLAPPWK